MWVSHDILPYMLQTRSNHQCKIRIFEIRNTTPTLYLPFSHLPVESIIHLSAVIQHIYGCLLLFWICVWWIVEWWCEWKILPLVDFHFLVSATWRTGFLLFSSSGYLYGYLLLFWMCVWWWIVECGSSDYLYVMYVYGYLFFERSVTSFEHWIFFPSLHFGAKNRTILYTPFHHSCLYFTS